MTDCRSHTFEQQLESLISRLMDKWAIPGVAVGVVKNGRVEFLRGFGYADIEDEKSVTTDTLFAIGSMTKAFTATAAGVLVQAGKLDINRPLRCYLPEFELKDPVASQQASARDLLCHRTGVPEHTLLWYQSGLRRSELVERLRWLEPTAEFREQFQYQNLMYTTIGELIERLGEVSYERFVQENIFEPLGMSGTRFGPLEVPDKARSAVGYLREGQTWVPMPYYDESATGPQGGIYSSIADMMKWLLANILPETCEQTPTIMKDAISMCHQPQITVPSSTSETNYCPGSYGMGWFVTSHANRVRLTHSGGIDGFCCLIDCLPQEECGLVVMTNRHGAPEPNAAVLTHTIVLTAYDMLLGREPGSWEEKMDARRAKVAAERLAMDTVATCDEEPLSGSQIRSICGQYRNPAYGLVQISGSDDRPCIVYRGNESPLSYSGGLEFIGKVCSQSVSITFSYDASGQVAEMVLKFRGGVSAKFHRM